jgi:hypothetical protein
MPGVSRRTVTTYGERGESRSAHDRLWSTRVGRSLRRVVLPEIGVGGLLSVAR